MSNELATNNKERNITDGVLDRVNNLSQNGGLVLPQNYSAANALKSAWLILQETRDKNMNPALSVCTRESVCNSLLDMTIQGLSPVKKQCYFVVYGNQLQLMRSYMGTVSVTKRLKGIRNVYANCIYEGDVFDYEINLETGTKRITKHEQKFENIDMDKILGAYAVIVRDDDENFIEVMNMDQIRKAWGQGATKGNSGAHKNFTDEMAKKTVINRACKLFANTSDDSELLIESFNRTTENEYDDFSSRSSSGYAPELGNDDTSKVDELNKSIFAGSPFDTDAPDTLTPAGPVVEENEAAPESIGTETGKEEPELKSSSSKTVKVGDQDAATND